MSSEIENYLKYANLQMAAESLFFVPQTAAVGTTSTTVPSSLATTVMMWLTSY